jgi:DNA-binding YbaB/EbfC family protein
MPGFDINELMQQAQALQQKMQESQERLAKKEVTGTAGGGMVIVTANGKGEILKVQIDKQVVDPRDVPMLEDLILAAVNTALRAAQEAQAAEGPMSQMPDLSGLAGMFGGGGGGGFPR